MMLILILLFGCSEKTDTIKLKNECEHFKYNSTKDDKALVELIDEKVNKITGEYKDNVSIYFRN